jgi:hypothetical protein
MNAAQVQIKEDKDATVERLKHDATLLRSK